MLFVDLLICLLSKVISLFNTPTPQVVCVLFFDQEITREYPQ